MAKAKNTENSLTITESKKAEQCFVITPIGDDNSDIRRHIEGIIDAVIKPALENQYEVVVAHRISTPGSITKQIIEAIYNSKLVIANLTNCNPNVMYELALRHGIGKPVIMIAELGTKLPSDVMMQRTIFYRNDAMGVLKLREDLKEAANKIDFNTPTGLVFETLGEISHDAAMLKSVAEKDTDSKAPLEYIMRRLDRIERSLDTQAFTPDFGTNYTTSSFVLRYETDVDNASDLPSESEIDIAARDALVEFGGRIKFIEYDLNKIIFTVAHPSELGWGRVAMRLHKAMERIGLSFGVLERE